MDPATFGRCDHALRQVANPLRGYEVGVTANGDGTYRLVYDAFGNGRELERLCGVDLSRLGNEVAAEVAERVMRRRGFRVQRVDEQAGERIRLVATQ